MSKITHGQFFTERDIFKTNIVFEDFMTKNNLWSQKILEPFAGANNLIKFLQNKNPKISYASFDLEPKDENVIMNDSLKNWNYQNFNIVITNPPYLAKHSAHRMKLEVDFGEYDDLYKVCLAKCLENVRYTIAIIPTTLINSNRKMDQKLIQKLLIFQLLPDNQNFNDTEHPVALAFFDNQKDSNDFDLFENNISLRSYQKLLKKQEDILSPKNTLTINFNHSNGNLCIYTSDNTKNWDNVKFFKADKILAQDVKNTNRHKVKILVVNKEISDEQIKQLNNKILLLRENKCDFLWASFKGISKTGHFRKRVDFGIIKKIINSVL